MTTQLNQIIAIEKGAKSQANRDLTDAYHRIQKTPLLTGIEREYQVRDEAGDQLPSESTRVQVRAEETLRSAIERSLVRLFDVTLTKEASNTKASADVEVDGVVLLADVPVTYLLFLEKQLTDVKTTILALPVLDPAKTWVWNENAKAFAAEPVKTTKTKKEQRPLTLAPATDKHPAQVQLITEDVLVGEWTTINFSGAVPGSRQQELVERVEKLVDAVKFAREKANTREIEDRKAGAEIFGYLFGN